MVKSPFDSYCIFSFSMVYYSIFKGAGLSKKISRKSSGRKKPDLRYVMQEKGAS